MEEKFFEEGNVKINRYFGKISKKLPVFYNPLMKLNRDISILILDYFIRNYKKNLKICLPLSGSGIRGIRFLKLFQNNISLIKFNDKNPLAVENIEENLELNGISISEKSSKDKITVTKLNANLCMNQNKWDYIEIDPFGSPVLFIDNAIINIKNNSILSVTATDTAALCGTYPNKSLRRYFIKTKKTDFYDELGLRNLISFCVREGFKYDKALIPILSYSQNHYYKVFFLVKKSITEVKKLINKLKYLDVTEDKEIIIKNYLNESNIGPTYIGELNNKEVLKDLNLDLINDKKAEDLMNKLIEELDIVGYYNLHKLIGYYKIKKIPKKDKLFSEIKKRDYKVSGTHNSKYGIKTNMPKKDLIKLIKEMIT